MPCAISHSTHGVIHNMPKTHTTAINSSVLSASRRSLRNTVYEAHMAIEASASRSPTLNDRVATPSRLPRVAITITPQKEIATPIHWRRRIGSPSSGAASSRIKIGAVERYSVPLVAVV